MVWSNFRPCFLLRCKRGPIYTQNSHTRNSLPSPSLAFQTTPSTLQQISFLNPLARYNDLQTFPESSILNFLIPVPVWLSSKCDTRLLHPLANTSSKPLVPLA